MVGLETRDDNCEQGIVVPAPYCNIKKLTATQANVLFAFISELTQKCHKGLCKKGSELY